MNPTRRTVLLAGAGAAAALLPSLPAAAAPKATASKAAGTTAAAALQPYASYWYPDSLPSGTPGTGITWRSLKSWQAADDPDLAFNAASVPLAARFTPTPANPTARADQARIQSLVSFGPTAATPRRARPPPTTTPSPTGRTSTNCLLGRLLRRGTDPRPERPVVDAAHRHGVPVLGNIFLPPVAYGGQLQWTRDLVQKDAAGRYPLAATDSSRWPPRTASTVVRQRRDRRRGRRPRGGHAGIHAGAEVAGRWRQGCV